MHSMAHGSADESGAPIGAVIGGRVRRRRAQRAWTLDELAARSGVSKRMLINIGQGSANPPSIATLLLISDALGVGLPALVDARRHTSGTRKLLLVLEGTIELKAGQDTQRLAAGDSASFRSDVADSYGNPASPGPHAPTARFALAVFEPQVGPGDKS
jgi:transcriptional regulator with XRE-family HTH domain